MLLKPKSKVFAGSILGKPIINAMLPKKCSSLSSSVLHAKAIKKVLGKQIYSFPYDLFLNVFKSILSFQFNTIFVSFIYSLKEKPSSNCHQKCPSIGMLSGERLFSRSVTLGSNTFYCNKGRSGSSNDCILNQLDTYHSGLRTIFNLYYVKVRVKYNREPSSNDLLSCTLSFFIYFIK